MIKKSYLTIFCFVIAGILSLGGYIIINGSNNKNQILSVDVDAKPTDEIYDKFDEMKMLYDKSMDLIQKLDNIASSRTVFINDSQVEPITSELVDNYVKLGKMGTGNLKESFSGYDFLIDGVNKFIGLLRRDDAKGISLDSKTNKNFSDHFQMLVEMQIRDIQLYQPIRDDVHLTDNQAVNILKSIVGSHYDSKILIFYK